MTKEEKQLLLKDLCARFPYGVKGMVKTTDGNGQEITDDGVLNSVFINEHGAAYICIEGAEYELKDVKPYLRPMSSMTKEELKEFISFTSQSMRRFICEATNTDHWFNNYEEEDWLNKHHFDYRRLIEKGLALPAPEGMYNFK